MVSDLNQHQRKWLAVVSLVFSLIALLLFILGLSLPNQQDEDATLKMLAIAMILCLLAVAASVSSREQPRNGSRFEKVSTIFSYSIGALIFLSIFLLWVLSSFHD